MTIAALAIGLRAFNIDFIEDIFCYHRGLAVFICVVFGLSGLHGICMMLGFVDCGNGGTCEKQTSSSKGRSNAMVISKPLSAVSSSRKKLIKKRPR